MSRKPPKNDPAEEALLVATYQMLDAIDAYLKAHQQRGKGPCDCYLCDDVRGARWVAEILKNLLDAELLPFDAMLARASRRTGLKLDTPDREDAAAAAISAAG